MEIAKMQKCLSVQVLNVQVHVLNAYMGDATRNFFPLQGVVPKITDLCVCLGSRFL